MDNINNFLEKYDHFKMAQMRTIVPTSETSKRVTLVVQDDEGEDEVMIYMDFKGIQSSRILVDSVLAYLDMMGGISIVKENGLYGFALGRGTAMLHVQSAPLFIIASELSIEEKVL